MARKNLLAGLMSPKLPAGNSGANALQENELEPIQPARLTLGGRGAIGAVTRSIENLKAAASEAGEMRARLEAGQTVIDLDPDLVDPSPVLDRMPAPDGELTEFIEAIRLSGQQVPILVRPHPTTPGRYQTAYGHRRTRAARVLARPIRAVVRAMTDAELVVAQGQENSARRDLSFIERALYAAKLEDAGFDRETLTAALNVDKTGLSQLISVAVRSPTRGRQRDRAGAEDRTRPMDRARRPVRGSTSAGGCFGPTGDRRVPRRRERPTLRTRAARC